MKLEKYVKGGVWDWGLEGEWNDTALDLFQIIDVRQFPGRNKFKHDSCLPQYEICHIQHLMKTCLL